MKNAHRTELERELEKARKANSNNENADIEEIRKQHESVAIPLRYFSLIMQRICFLLKNKLPLQIELLEMCLQSHISTSLFFLSSLLKLLNASKSCAFCILQ